MGAYVLENARVFDDGTASFVAQAGAYIVPTLAILFATAEYGRQNNLPEHMRAKIDQVVGGAFEGLQRMSKARIKLGFGTDLVGPLYTQQCREFLLRREVFSPLDILRQATSIGAEVLQLQDKLGCISADAYADLIVVDGDPLRDISLLAQNGRNLSLIMRAGELVKNRLVDSARRPPSALPARHR